MCRLKIYSFFSSSLKKSVEEALKTSQLPTVMDFRKFSRNYHLSKAISLPSLDPVSAKIEGNLIFDPNNYLPTESMLKMTLSIFGFAPVDLFEVGVRLKKSCMCSTPFFSTPQTVKVAVSQPGEEQESCSFVFFPSSLTFLPPH